MSRINKIAKIIAKSFSIPLLSIGILAAMPTSSQAFTVKGCDVTVEINLGIIKVTLDPENIQSFNYSASFNPEELALQEIVYEDTYTQTTLPDLSQLSLGLIQGIAGSTSTPPAGNADLFSLIFTPLVTNPQSIVSFFPGSEGFLVIRDPETGDTRTLDPSECPSCEAPVNTPEPLTLLAAAASLGFGAVFKKQYSKK